MSLWFDNRTVKAMYIRNSQKYGKPLKIIHAGEYYASKEDEVVGTLLGSCIAVCLYDPEIQVAGMNHFMLPGKISKVDIFKDRTARYGITAMNELIDAVVKLGARRENLVAKVFGGGSVLEYKHKVTTIPEDNVRVARIMLELADIQIVQSDVGDTCSRKVLLDVKSGRAYLKKTRNRKIIDVITDKEIEFAKRNLVQNTV